MANWLGTQLAADRFSEMYRYRYYKRARAWKDTKVQAWETDGDVATATVVSPNPEDQSAPPETVLFVFNKADDTWLLNHRDSTDATLTYQQENVQASESLVAKMELSDGDAAMRVALPPNAETVVYTTVEGHVVAWDFASNTTRWKDTNPPEASGYGQKFAEAIAISADGNTAAVVFSDEQNEEKRPNSPIILFDLASGRRTAVLPGHNGPIKAVSFSKDAAHLFSLGEDALCRVWDLKAKKQSRSFVFNAYEDKSGQRVERAEYFMVSADNSVIIVENAYRSLSVVDIQTEQVRCKIPSPGLDGGFGLAADGSFCITTNTDKRILTKWDCQSGKQLNSWEKKHALPGYNYKLAISPDSRYLALPIGDWKAGLIDLNSGETVQEFSGHKSDVYCLAFSSDSKLLVTADGGGATNGTVCVWRVSPNE